MSLHLSDRFNFLGNRATGRAFVVGRKGGASLVNTDALELLTSADGGWREDPDYQEFLAQCVGAGWLVPQAPTQAPSVRWVDHAIHLRRIQYEINLVCNLECAHCYCSSSPRAPGGQSTEFVMDLVRQASAIGVLHFDVTGGEPLVRADIVDVIAAIREGGMVPGLFTNGTLVTAEKARALADAGLVTAQVSLDARTPALHDEIRGKAGAFDRAVRGLELLREAGINVRVAVCLNRKNAHETGEIVRFLREDLKVQFNMDRVIPAGRAHGHSTPFALENSEFYALMHQYMSVGEPVTGKSCDPINVESVSRIEPECGVGASYMFIKNDGRAALCPTLTEAESPEFVQADLHTMSLRQAWEEHPTFNRFRGMQCENAAVCPSGKKCRGGCRSNAYLIDGRLEAPDEFRCNLYKNGQPKYRPMLIEYEEQRNDGRLPPRVVPLAAPARRLLRVVA